MNRRDAILGSIAAVFGGAWWRPKPKPSIEEMRYVIEKDISKAFNIPPEKIISLYQDGRMTIREIRTIESRWGFTVVEVLVTLAIVATLIGLLTPAMLAAKQHAREREPEAVPESWSLLTRRHDGHLWIIAGGDANHFVHHPDCPCHGKVEKE